MLPGTTLPALGWRKTLLSPSPIVASACWTSRSVGEPATPGPSRQQRTSADWDKQHLGFTSDLYIDHQRKFESHNIKIFNHKPRPKQCLVTSCYSCSGPEHWWHRPQSVRYGPAPHAAVLMTFWTRFFNAAETRPKQRRGACCSEGRPGRPSLYAAALQPEPWGNVVPTPSPLNVESPKKIRVHKSS